MPSSQANLYDEMLRRHSNIVAMNEKEEQADDFDILFHMASGKLDPSEPYYAAQRRNFVKKNADNMRNKVRISCFKLIHSVA